MKKLVKIYCLYDPHILKIRYIGRTTDDLKKRLSEHISKAKNEKKYNPTVKGSHKNNWINSLLKEGIRPKIKLLTTIHGWKESHVLEKELIERYYKKHDLVNGDDRGPGRLGKNKNLENEKQRIEKIKNYFNKEENKSNFYNRVYVYNEEGVLINEYESAKFAAKDLNIDKFRISNHMNRFNTNVIPKSINGFYFNHKKYEIYPFVRSVYNFKRIRLYIDEMEFLSVSSFRKCYKLSSWDMTQFYKMIFTKRIKNIFKDKFVKIVKNNTAVLERNF